MEDKAILVSLKPKPTQSYKVKIHVKEEKPAFNYYSILDPVFHNEEQSRAL